MWVLAWWLAPLDTQGATSFTACGQTYELKPDYLALDYTPGPETETAAGATRFLVRSAAPGERPPDAPSAIFSKWPDDVAAAVTADYSSWRDGIGTDTEATSQGVGSFDTSDECFVVVGLNGRVSGFPRPDDWAIAIIEVRGA